MRVTVSPQFPNHVIPELKVPQVPMQSLFPHVMMTWQRSLAKPRQSNYHLIVPGTVLLAYQLPPNTHYVPQTLHHQVIQWVHTSLRSGHPRISCTLHLIRNSFWWPSMSKDVITSKPVRSVPYPRPPRSYHLDSFNLCPFHNALGLISPLNLLLTYPFPMVSPQS